MAKARPESELPRTLDAFERWHAEQPDRWEFILGTPVMMAPASLPHTIIKGNLFAGLRERLRPRGCHAYTDGAQIKAPELSAIPDVVVACRPPDLSTPVIAEPVLIVEINSPSTERDDTHRKWEGYCLLPSLQHYMIVAQARRFITVHTRTGRFSWTEQVHLDGTVELTALGISLPLDEIYEGIEFRPEAATYA